MLTRGSPSSDKTSMEADHKEGIVTVIAFYGTSCMGKSELVKFIRQKGADDGTHVVDVSIDTVARPMMDAYQEKNPAIAYEDIFMTIYGEIVQKFTDDIFRALCNLKPGKNILVMDDAWAKEKILERIASEDVAPMYK